MTRDYAGSLVEVKQFTLGNGKGCLLFFNLIRYVSDTEYVPNTLLDLECSQLPMRLYAQHGALSELVLKGLLPLCFFTDEVVSSIFTLRHIHLCKLLGNQATSKLCNEC